MVFPYSRMISSRPGLIFAIMVKPWFAGDFGKIGPKRPCSSWSLKNPSFGIAMAAGFVQSFRMSAVLSFLLPVFARRSEVSGLSVIGRLSSCKAGYETTEHRIRDNGQNSGCDQQLQSVNAGMNDDLVNRVQDQSDDENCPDILPALSQQLAPLARIREN